MNGPLFAQDVMQAVTRASFEASEPCPWASFDGLLTKEWFRKLDSTFPPLELFEKHRGLPRSHGQRPHDRWYLALEHSIYEDKKPGVKGCVSLNELDHSWQQFVTAIRESGSYNRMIKELLGDGPFVLRFAWHVAGNGCDVSPHVDDPLKAGTHIFYFNTSDSWQEAWGGQTLFLKNRTVKGMNPEISDFERSAGAPILDNKSMLFRNTPDAWHGVAPIQCSKGHYRRLFNAIFQRQHRPARRPNVARRIASRAMRLLAG